MRVRHLEIHVPAFGLLLPTPDQGHTKAACFLERYQPNGPRMVARSQEALVWSPVNEVQNASNPVMTRARSGQSSYESYFRDFTPVKSRRLRRIFSHARSAPSATLDTADGIGHALVEVVEAPYNHLLC